LSLGLDFRHKFKLSFFRILHARLSLSIVNFLLDLLDKTL